MFNYISIVGPIILFLFTFVLLKNKTTLLHIYLFGFFISSIINYVLKGFLKDPRPNEDVHVFNMELNSPSRRIGFDRFGLPSSTAQSVIFSLVYIYFSLKNTKITFAYFIIAFLSIVQKIIYNNNTIIQIVAGVFVGTLLAYSFYEYAKHILKRELKEKLEDDGPV